MQKTLKSADYGRLLDLLVAERHRSDLTQQQVARALGRPQSFVAKYEGGERRLDVLEFVAVARALGADPVRLLGKFLADEKPKSPVKANRQASRR